MPKPRPMAVRVTTSKGSSGSCSDVFEMDIGRDIAYHIRLVLEKETGKSSRPGRPGQPRLLHAMANPIYPLILAGGSGEPFWPRRRRAGPKQVRRLGSQGSRRAASVARPAVRVPP